MSEKIDLPKKITEKNLEFGDRVIVKNKLERRSRSITDKTNEGYYYGTLKIWQEPLYNKNFTPREGIFLGYRTLNNGFRRSFTDHIGYKPKYYFTAALVATDSKTNPFYCTKLEKL